MTMTTEHKRLSIWFDEGQTNNVVVNNRIAFYKFMQDDDDPFQPITYINGRRGEVPGDWDGEGKIYVFDSHDDYQAALEMREENPHIIWLEKYEHSGEHWSIASEGNYPDRRWDVTNPAGIWIPDEDVFGNVGNLEGDELKQKLREYCEGVLNTWNQWLSGDVWGFDLKIYRLMLDEDGDIIEDLDEYESELEPIYDESVWGFFGAEHVKEEVQSTIEHYLQGRTATYPNGPCQESVYVYNGVEDTEPFRKLTDAQRTELIEKRVTDSLYNGDLVQKLVRKHFEGLTDKQLQDADTTTGA